jgi:hypothetical protein
MRALSEQIIDSLCDTSPFDSMQALASALACMGVADNRDPAFLIALLIHYYRQAKTADDQIRKAGIS